MKKPGVPVCRRGRKFKLIKRFRIPNNYQEEHLREKGFKVICGLDEVGRGAWAGPLVAAAVILNKRYYKLRDSKLLKSKDREKLSKKIKRSCVWGIGEVTVKEIDKLKLTKATQLAFKRAVKSLRIKPDFILSDGFKFLSPIPCRSIIKGDMTCLSISAASIIAKVHRDKLMRALDKKIKGYYFSKHKGYGTKLHQRRLKKLGPSTHHRKSYRPINRLTNKKNKI